ncbi:MAG TPA: cupin domain-containing protein [Pirellulales bacterium]|nr:cupin domain-containing protein [Pirellulales bacterium]
MERTEIITRLAEAERRELAAGVEVQVLATGAMGAQGLTTSLANFRPGATLPYHRHPFSEVLVVLAGSAQVSVAGRRYVLRPYDTIHIPADTPHAAHNPSSDVPAVLHSSFASDSPTREAVSEEFAVEDRVESDPAGPETLVRFEQAPVYELAPQAHFRDLFARRFGSRGVCGGYGVFEPGASLPCHYHAYDESITIVAGRAVCQVAGREYELSDMGTACIPRGRPHRFLNRSNQPMAMIWVYAGDEPERTIVDPAKCAGSLG